MQGRVSAGEDRANRVEARARKTLDRMFELRAVVEGLNQTVSGEHASVAGLTDADLVSVRSFITAALSESEGTVREAMCDVRDGFTVETSSDALDLSEDDSFN